MVHLPANPKGPLTKLALLSIFCCAAVFIFFHSAGNYSPEVPLPSAHASGVHLSEAQLPTAQLPEVSIPTAHSPAAHLPETPLSQGSSPETPNARPGSNKRAISTIFTGPTFIQGIIALSYSISKHAPDVDKLVIVSNSYLSKGITVDHLNLLGRIGFKLKFFDDLSLPDGKDEKDKAQAPRFVDLLLKLAAWNMTEYSSIALLDADILLNDSLKYPMDLLEASNTHLGAVPAPPHNPGRPQPPYFELVSAHFNAGVLFIKPDSSVFNSLVSKSQRREEYATLALADQSFLNTQYAGNWLSLPVRYNVANMANRPAYFKAFLTDVNWDFGILHFPGIIANKPWSKEKGRNKKEEKGRNMWRAEYNRALKEYGLKKGDIPL